MAKIPPPPPIASQDQTFNRWLLELTSFLNASGDIDTNSIEGYNGLVAQVAQNDADIESLSINVSSLSNATSALAGRVTAAEVAIADLQTRTTAAENNIVALQARSQVRFGTGAPAAGLGGVGDWYGNIGGAAGSRVYIKTAVATWTAFPF